VTVSTAAPTVSLSASPNSVSQGSASTLTWAATNASSCIASGGWSGTLAGSGSQSTGALKTATTYSLSCTGTGGTGTQSITIAVTAPSGTAALTWTAPATNTDGTPITPLTGYHIFYGNAQDALTQSVSITGASHTSYEITGLGTGTWFFAVAADAADGTQSAKSALGSKTI